MSQANLVGSQLLELVLKQAEWSQDVFGPDSDRGPVGALRHLKQEADEAIAAPNDLTEYADCLLLLLDASRRAGFSVQQLIHAAIDKQAVNSERNWPEMAEQPSDAPVGHIE